MFDRQRNLLPAHSTQLYLSENAKNRVFQKGLSKRDLYEDIAILYLVYLLLLLNLG